MTASVAERLAALPRDERNAIVDQLTPAEQEALLFDWREFLARPEQITPEGDWDIWLIMSGRGWGKTRTGAEWVKEAVRKGYKRIALIGETAADARDVMVEGVSGILSVYPEAERPLYEPSKRRLTWPNGAVATTFNATEPDQLRGPQFDLCWADELCLISGTQIKCEFGQKPIESVRAGDRVWTRKGLRRVAKAWKTTDSAEVWKLTSVSGKSITGTANHPVWTEESGFVPLRSMRSGVTLCAWKSNELSGAANAGIYTGITSAIERVSYCIEKSISMLTGQSRKAMTFITSMATRPTTTFPTWLPSLALNTCENMGQRVFSFGTQSNEATTRPNTYGVSANPRQSHAIAAAVSSNRLVCGQSTAGRTAEQRGSGNQTPVTMRDAVESVERLPDRAAVYNIEVEGEPEYFANGILTHNCKWRYARETWDQLQFGLRLGEHPRVLVTTTPRPIELAKSIVAGSEGKVHITRGTTMDNRSNLAGKFLEKIQLRYEGTRLGRQELRGEILGDIPNALWTYGQIEASRVRQCDPLDRVVVSVDPAISNNEDSDEHGIIVAGVHHKSQEAYVLEDGSMQGSPMEWARRAINLYDTHKADAIVIEVNQGGDMVAQTLRSVRNTVKIKEVRATRGKHVRAEPIASMYEQGRVHHVGSFPQLETQMTQMTTFGYEGAGSPDRVDALVWAMTDLFPSMVGKTANQRTPVKLVPIVTPMAR